MFTWLWNTLFPTSLQNLFLCVVGAHLFYLATARLSKYGIDVAAALSYGWGNDRLLNDCVQIVRVAWAIYLSAILLFPIWPTLVMFTAWIAFLSLLFTPISYFGGALRRTFALSLLRTASPLQWSLPTLFVDNVVGDILTSYAKVFASWDALLFCYLLRPAGSTDLCLPSVLSVLLVCYPYFCRLRQCISDYRSNPTFAWRPLLNALKYSTSFPVIYLSFLLLHPEANPLWRTIWMIAVTVNTVYSIFWDFLVDWDLGYAPSNSKQVPFLRPTLIFKDPSIYYGALLLNVICRASWTLRVLTAAFYAKDHAVMIFLEGAHAIFLFQLVEISRRFLWFVFRLESYQLQQSSE